MEDLVAVDRGEGPVGSHWVDSDPLWSRATSCQAEEHCPDFRDAAAQAPSPSGCGRSLAVEREGETSWLHGELARLREENAALAASAQRQGPGSLLSEPPSRRPWRDARALGIDPQDRRPEARPVRSEEFDKDGPLARSAAEAVRRARAAALAGRSGQAAGPGPLGVEARAAGWDARTPPEHARVLEAPRTPIRRQKGRPPPSPCYTPEAPRISTRDIDGDVSTSSWVAEAGALKAALVSEEAARALMLSAQGNWGLGLAEAPAAQAAAWPPLAAGIAGVPPSDANLHQATAGVACHALVADRGSGRWHLAAGQGDLLGS